MDITIKTAHNLEYLQNLPFDYKINNLNIKKNKSLAYHVFINILASVMKRNLSTYSEIIFYYNTRIHSK